MQKVGVEAALLWASLWCPFILFSTRKKKQKPQHHPEWAELSSADVASPARKEKHTLQVSLPITLISFKRDNLPRLGAFPSFVFFFFLHTSFTMMRFLSRSERSACEEEAENKSNHRLTQKAVFKRPDALSALARDDGGKESHMIEEPL